MAGRCGASHTAIDPNQPSDRSARMASYKLAEIYKIDNIPENEIAYISGLIDADGTITIPTIQKRRDGKPKFPSPMVLIVNGNLGLIRWIKEKIGFGCAYETKTRPIRPDQNAAHWNPVHRYQLTGRPASRLLTRCLPYLLVKRQQAEIVLSIAMKSVDFAMEATERQHAHASWCVSQIRILNQRGKKDIHQLSMIAFSAQNG